MTRRSLIGIVAFTVVFVAVMGALGGSERGRLMSPERPAARERAQVPMTLPEPPLCPVAAGAPCAEATRHDDDIAAHMARNDKRLERIISIMAKRDLAGRREKGPG